MPQSNFTSESNPAPAGTVASDRSTVDGVAEALLRKAQPTPPPQKPKANSTPDVVENEQEDDALDTSEEQEEEADDPGDDDAQAGEEGGAEDENEDDFGLDEGDPDKDLSIKVLPPEELDRKFKIRASGEVVEVPLKELFQSYASATERTRLASELNQGKHLVQQAAGRYAVLLQALETTLAQQLPSEPTAEQWQALAASDPIEYARQKDHWRDQKERHALTVAERKRVMEENRRQEEARAEALIESEWAQLQVKLPGLKDSNKARKFQSAVQDYLRSEGFTEDEIAQAYSHRQLITAYKAMMFDKGRSAISKAKTPVNGTKKTPAVLQPGTQRAPITSQQAQFKRASAQFKKTGKTSDLAAVLERKAQLAARGR